MLMSLNFSLACLHNVLQVRGAPRLFRPRAERAARAAHRAGLDGRQALLAHAGRGPFRRRAREAARALGQN